VDRDAGCAPRVIAVIGSGFAGCAAAVALARAGHRIELYEAATMPGGRARTVMRDGLPLDNGEHLLLGACTETLTLAAFVHGPSPHPPWRDAPLAMQPLAPGRQTAPTLRARALPAPLGLAAGLLTARGFTWRERIAAAHWFVRQRRTGFRCDDDVTVAALVADLPARVRDELWMPLCVAALNTAPARASGQVFLNVLREALGANAPATRIVHARDGLGALLPEPAVRWLAAQGHRVHLSTRARVALRADGVRIGHAGGETAADAASVAVGPHQLDAAFDPELAAAPGIAAALRAVAAFDWEPIVTVYLGYGSAFAVPPRLTRLDDEPGQWLFDRSDILARAAKTAPPGIVQLLSVVMSARGAHAELAHPALVAAVDAQLRRLAPDVPPLAWSQVIAERRATYACVPALARPAFGRVAERVYHAGDYTCATFPATLEAAVRSGTGAARALLADLPALNGVRRFP
jgi:squalene-associated FAD-dependent desaturase